MKFVTASLSETGPRNQNEDAFGVWCSDNGAFSAAIADGLGGTNGGNLAAKFAINFFGEKILGTDQNISRLVLDIHDLIQEYQKSGIDFGKMATTFSGFIIQPDGKLFGAHCGDTRISVARKSGIKRLTTDQTEANRLLATGKISKEEYIDYPRKHILDSALGISGVPQIEEINFNIQEGDWIFLTSDGIHNKILLRELLDISAKSAEPPDAIEQIKLIMDSRIPDDNYTVVIVSVS